MTRDDYFSLSDLIDAVCALIALVFVACGNYPVAAMVFLGAKALSNVVALRADAAGRIALKYENQYLVNARDDEPLFVLRSSDKLAPQLVREWAHRAQASGTPDAKVGEALELADKMEIYAAKHFDGGKVPD